MEYVYAAMLLHKSGHKVDEEGVNKVLTSAGVTPNPARTKALVSALDGVDIEAAIKEAAVATVAVAAAPAAASHAPKKEEKKEDEKKSEQAAAAGLGALFG